MSVWDQYQERIEAHGGTKRGAALQREIRFINRRLPDNLSYHTVTVYTPDVGYNIEETEARGESIIQQAAIINSDNLNEKTMISMPGENIVSGSLVHWMDNYWLVTEKDANTTIYTRTKLLQCNYLLKWVAGDGTIYSQWCVVEDGTKYLTGEYEDRYFVTTRGDSRMYLIIARNDKTVALNRTSRFLIDDPESQPMLSYSLTKPFKLGGMFNNEGVYKFVLQEVNSTDDDNHELGIADYYKYYPRTEEPGTIPSDGKKVWL